MHMNNKVCTSQMKYVEDNLICTCSKTGEWVSVTCRAKFQYLKSIQHLRKTSFDMAHTNFDCTPEKYYLVECNVCLCPAPGYMTAFHCTKRHCRKGSKSESCKPGQFLRLPNEICTCSANGYYIDRLCLKIANFRIQRINDKELAIISDTSLLQSHIMGDEVCQKNQIYQADCNFCHCNNAGVFICTSKLCQLDAPKRILRNSIDTGNPLYVDGVLQLPELEDLDEACVPGQRYRHKCNKCQCSANAVPICTTMLCVGYSIASNAANLGVINTN